MSILIPLYIKNNGKTCDMCDMRGILLTQQTGYGSHGLGWGRGGGIACEEGACRGHHTRRSLLYSLWRPAWWGDEQSEEKGRRSQVWDLHRLRVGERHHMVSHAVVVQIRRGGESGAVYMKNVGNSVSYIWERMGRNLNLPWDSV